MSFFSLYPSLSPPSCHSLTFATNAADTSAIIAIMHLHRVRTAESSLTRTSDSTMHIRVEVSVEVTGEFQVRTSGFYDIDRISTPITPIPPASTSLMRPRALPDTAWEGLPPYLEATLRANSHDAVYGYYTGMDFVFPEPPPGFRVLDITEASRIADATINEVLSLGQPLISKEDIEGHANAIFESDGDVKRYIPVSVWMQRLGPLWNIDKPLFFFLRDSLHSHTPHHILFRWEVLRRHMRDAGETIAKLVRRAEQEPRKKWTPLVLELYFLMLDHNEALVKSTPELLPHLGSLEVKLSALTTALRIQYYLFRMTRPNPMGGLRQYKQQLRATAITNHMKKLHGLVAQEFARMRDPVFGHFQSAERALVGDPVKLDSITEPLKVDGRTFCTICQDEHAASESVRPRNCRCIFGRGCLDPLLNRDLPFSNACPNCRAQLHEPLQWRPVLSRDERDMRTGLLWALRSNMLSLKKEIQSDPDPFTDGQCAVGWVRRLIHGRLGVDRWKRS